MVYDPDRPLHDIGTVLQHLDRHIGHRVGFLPCLKYGCEGEFAATAYLSSLGASARDGSAIFLLSLVSHLLEEVGAHHPVLPGRHGNVDVHVTADVVDVIHTV